ncbi:hypothetical protein NKH77_24400 [Streptomyces sp. M19]
MLEAMDESVPALVYGPGTDVLAWNRIGGRVAFDLAAIPEPERNAALMVFLRPEARRLHPDWDRVADETVASLRAEIGRYRDEVRCGAWCTNWSGTARSSGSAGRPRRCGTTRTARS